MKIFYFISILALALFANEMPKWIYTPSLDGVIGAVGYSAPNEDKKLQRKIALIDARGKLSESLKIKIENETLKSSSSDGNSNFERKSIRTSDNLVRGAKVKEEFVDEDGSLYLWLVTK